MKWLILYQVLSLALVAAILVGGSTFAKHTRANIDDNRQRLLTMSSFVELQYYLRANGHMLIKQWYLFTTIFEEQLVGRVIPQPTQLLNASVLQNVKASLNRVYNSMPGGSVQFSIDRAAWYLSKLETAAVVFELNRWSNTLMDVDLGLLGTVQIKDQDLNQKTLLKEGPTRVAGITESIRSIITRSRDALNLVKEIEPYMIGKEPPFNMPEEVTKKLAKAALMHIQVFTSTFEQLQSKVLALSNEVANIVLVLDTRKFNISFWTAICILSAGIVLYVISLAISTQRIRVSLSDTTMMYQLLKVNEAESHLVFYQTLLEKLSRFSLDEARMVTEYSVLRRIQNQLGQFMLSFKDGPKRMKKQLRSTPFSGVLVSQGVRILFATGLFNTLLLVGIVTALAMVGLNLKKFKETEEFFIVTYRGFATSNHQYLYFQTLATLGNFIKIDGKYPEDEWPNRSKAISNFLQHWLSKISTISDHYEPEDVVKLNSMLFGNICEHFPRSANFEIVLYNLCIQYKPAAKGIYAYLLDEIDLHTALVSTEIPKQRSFMASTRKAFARSPFTTFIFNDANLIVAELHQSMIESFRAIAFGAVLKSMSDRINVYQLQVEYIETIGVCLIVLVFCVSTFKSNERVSIDQQVALESITTVRPNSLKHNKLLQNKLDAIYFNYSRF